MTAAWPTSQNAVRQRREAARPGPSELARRAGMTRQALHRVESGASAPGVAVALHLAHAPECRVEAGLLGAGHVFARNRLLIVAPKSSSAVNTLADLVKPGVKLVLADKAVPVGDTTRKALDLISKSGTYGPDFAVRVLTNTVSEEPNVRLKVGLGQGDAAVVYASDLTPSLRPAVRTIGLPTRFNPLTSYPLGALTGSANAEVNRAEAGWVFVACVLSAQGQRVLRKWLANRR